MSCIFLFAESPRSGWIAGSRRLTSWGRHLELVVRVSKYCSSALSIMQAIVQIPAGGILSTFPAAATVWLQDLLAVLVVSDGKALQNMTESVLPAAAHANMRQLASAVVLAWLDRLQTPD
jgi:hypothetical protein